MINNLWAHWHLHNLENLTFALNGMVTTINKPLSRSATWDFVAILRYLDQPKRVRAPMETPSDEYCYRYEYDQRLGLDRAGSLKLE
jgi:hypothetical protein